MRVILEVSAKKLVTTFEEFRKRFSNTVNDFSSPSSVPDKPEAIEKTADSYNFNVGFLSNDNKANDFMKARAKLRCQVRRQLRPSSSDLDKLQEQYELKIEELEKALAAMLDTISETILGIALKNDDFICTGCLSTAAKLYRLLCKYAQKRDTDWICDEFKRITGRNLND